jgi:hypothetical protein
VLTGALVREVDHAAGKFPEEAVASVSPEKEFVGVPVEQESQPRIQPRAVKEFQIVEGRVEIKRRKHGERFVELLDAPTVVEKQETIDEGSFASGNQDIICTALGLEKMARWSKEDTGRSDAMVDYAVEDNVLAGLRRKIVDGLESLIGDAVQFKCGMDSDNGIVTEGERHAIAVQRRGGVRSRVDAVRYGPDPPLTCKPVELIQYGAIALILFIEPACVV